MKVGSVSGEVLCDVHLEKMSWQSYEIKDSQDQEQRAFHVCRSQGCLRRFASSLGYVDMISGQLEPTNRVYRPCEKSPTHGKMSKAIARLQDGDPVWECLYCLAAGPDVRGSVSRVA